MLDHFDLLGKLGTSVEKSTGEAESVAASFDYLKSVSKVLSPRL